MGTGEEGLISEGKTAHSESPDLEAIKHLRAELVNGYSTLSPISPEILSTKNDMTDGPKTSSSYDPDLVDYYAFSSMNGDPIVTLGPLDAAFLAQVNARIGEIKKEQQASVQLQVK